jgi:hypothetical protein
MKKAKFDEQKSLSTRMRHLAEPKYASCFSFPSLLRVDNNPAFKLWFREFSFHNSGTKSKERETGQIDTFLKFHVDSITC